MKKCKTCGLEKEETEFFKKKVKWLEGSCKICRKKREKELIGVDPESHREKVRLRSEQRRSTEEWKEWRKDHQARNREEITKKSREYYHSHPEVVEKAKIWREKHREVMNESVKAHKKRNPLDDRARKILNYHVSKGNMTRPSKCSVCLKECKAEAHHTDYTKPLDVIWLCRLCHGKEHRKYE